MAKKIKVELKMWILIAIIALSIILFFCFKNKNHKKKKQETETNILKMPYDKKNKFLTEAEFNFYKTLKLFLNDKNIIICPKVGLKDFIYVTKEAENESIKYFNKIAKKHIDFLLCDTKTMKIICAIELDDKSHNQKKRKERDDFINKLYEKVNINIIHINVRETYKKEDIKNILEIISMDE